MFKNIGKYHYVTINRLMPQGAYIQAEEEEILLPGKYVPEGAKPGDELEVFIYRDSEDRLVAVTTKPFATVGQAAYLEVKEVSDAGAFMDWGIEKDLLVPYKEQKDRMKEGRSYLVYLYVDDVTNRIVGTSKISKFINNNEITVEEGEQVELLIYEPMASGIRVIVNDKHWGLVYKNEVFKSIKPGDRVKGFITKIREEDKIDVSLQQQGHDEALNASLVILKKLKENNGFLPLTDKTEPGTIYEMLQMSKKTFKRAVGSLYKEKNIELTDSGIQLLQSKSGNK